ncbi:MAG: B12-binding domain-containing radical SAM protein [Candidatus Methylomirabilia bacterium]
MTIVGANVSDRDLLLVYPRTRYPSGDVPLGILCLAASVREKLSLAPVVFDFTFRKDPFAELREHLRTNRYSWVGISAMITMAKDAREVARLVREMQPDARIILGGPHPTTLSAQCLTGDYDFVVVGEGEATLPELIGRGSGEGVAGVWFRKGGVWRENQPRAPIADLDDIPFPAFDLIDLVRYKKLWFQLDTTGRPIEGTSVFATRGCPYQCSFCQPTLERLFGRKLRKRSPENIVAELAWLKRDFHIEGFMLQDDTLNVDREWTRQLAREIVAGKLGLVFGCNMRADLVDEETLRVMQEAGLRKIYIGIESCSDRIRNDVYDKRLQRVQIEKAVAAAKKHGILVQGYFMIGAPGEKKSEVKATLRYARALDLDDLTINIATPLPGSYLYQKFRGDIAIPEEGFDYYRRYAFLAGELDERWLRRAQLLGYLAFYLRPRLLLRFVRSLLSPRMFRRTLLKVRRVV